MQGFATALMANTQLMGYFLDKRERSAAIIQGIGIVSNYAVLFQVRTPSHTLLADATCALYHLLASAALAQVHVWPCRSST